MGFLRSMWESPREGKWEGRILWVPSNEHCKEIQQ
jgi:hypothetical protein